MSVAVPAESLSLRGRLTFPRGVHPPERKDLVEGSPIEVLPTPAEVRVPVLQHLGAPCEISVKLRAEVTLGDEIARATAYISAPVHASISGTVGRESVTTLPNGRHVAVVPIKAAAEQPLTGQALYQDVLGGEWRLDGFAEIEPQQIAHAARAAGLVGLGGAAFPTHVKLTRNESKPIHTLLINGCECEPYLTADYRLMIEAPASILAGALLAQRATGAGNLIVCVEDNKPLAIQKLYETARDSAVQLRVMKTKYPQGGEKQLIAAVLGLEVPLGGLPLDVGVVVLNVGSAAALARAVLRNRPLTHRVVTVSGRGICQPKNLLVPIGTSFRDVIAHCGGLVPDAVRVVAGGPMMGFAVGTLDTPVTKGTSGITVYTREEIRRAEETTCVRCGQCVDVCPMRLVPTRLALAARAGNAALAERYAIQACVECGCCAYTCPASIPLVQLIRVGKILVRNATATRKN